MSGLYHVRPGTLASPAAERTRSVSCGCRIAALCVGPVRGAHGSRHVIATRATSITSLGSDSNNGAPAPLRYTWADDGEHLQVVELQSAIGPGSDAQQGGAQQLKDVVSALETVASSAGSSRSALLSPASQLQLLRVLQPLLPALTVPGATRLFACYQSLGIPTGPYVTSVASGAAATVKSGEPAAQNASSSSAADREWMATSDALVSCALQRLGGQPLHQAGAVELSELLWALSELDHIPWTPEASSSSSSSSGSASTSGSGSPSAADAFLASAQQALRQRVESQDFLAPALAKAVCALGSLVAERRQLQQEQLLQQQQQAGGGGGGGGVSGSGSSNDDIDQGLIKALFEEARYQLTEFGSDFSATDLARLTSGMADLRMARLMDEEFRRVLMKAVYGRTRSIAEKGAVDFALKKLFDDEEARSMHFDTRWTHEELNWLPRRERDKRRIMQEHWSLVGRTQWGGWAR